VVREPHHEVKEERLVLRHSKDEAGAAWPDGGAVERPSSLESLVLRQAQDEGVEAGFAL